MCCGACPCEFGIFQEATCKFYFFVCLVAYASPMQSIEYMARSLIGEVNISTRRKVRRVVTQKHSFKIFVRQFTAGTSVKTRLRQVGFYYESSNLLLLLLLKINIKNSKIFNIA